MAILASEHAWVLETKASGYAFGLNEAGLLAHRYWGPRLPRLADYPAAPNPAFWASFESPAQRTPEEYPGHGGIKFIDPCLKVTFANGVRDVVLRFAGYDLRDGPRDTSELQVHLKDRDYPLRVTLHYRVHEAYDLVERWATVANDDTAPIWIRRVWSAQWHMPTGVDYRLTHVSGRWLDEMHLRREPLTHGVKILESRRLTTSHQHNPWFAVDAGTAGERAGEVWFGLLEWSGNWKLSAEVTEYKSTRVSLGINDWDFEWRLDPGQSFTTPSSFGGFTTEGFGGMSRSLHDFIRDRVLPHGQAPHKVLYNSWEATEFDVDEPTQVQLAERAAALGVELFVLDDGWFHGRTADNAGLGDWWPDERKFPNGLTPLIDRVNALGMDFGLWVEPEMVNPDSDLYRAHPDWVLHFPGRARTEARNQLVLNLGRPDVQEYLIEVLDRLLAEHNIAFVKWDMNRNVSEPGWPDATGEARELWVRYVHGLYRLLRTLRDRHPNVVFQSCSGGGGRADLGMLRFADQVWVSDNTEATARLHIQEGYSYVYPANTMEAWVTDMNPDNLSLAYRFHVSMCGVLGVGGHLAQWTEEECAEAANWIALYKAIRPIVQYGDQYRLGSPQAQAFSAVLYVSKDKSEAVLFAFRTHMPPPAALPPLRLSGLDPDALYAIEGLEEARSGQAWMHAGVQIDLRNFQSTMRQISKS
ncbi:MAG: alpha-galactosidase [Chloroflexia bacterium]